MNQLIIFLEYIGDNLQYDDDEETTGEVLISVQPVHQGCVTSLKHDTEQTPVSSDTTFSQSTFLLLSKLIRQRPTAV